MPQIKILLNAIVRDEEENMGQCFASVANIIDGYAISDTGSKDNTIGKIREIAEKRNLPGEVISEEWKNFGYNRTVAIKLAEEVAKKLDSSAVWYILFMDADNRAHSYDGKMGHFELDKQSLTLDSYDVEMRSGGTAYHFIWLCRLDAKKKFKWVGRRHEVCQPDGQWPCKSEMLKGGYVVSGRNGFRKKNPYTYAEDLCEFLKDLKDDPKNDRAMFYAAQSARDTGFPDVAKQYYKRRAAMGGWQEEVYESLLWLARSKMEKNADDPKCWKLFMDAINASPSRYEAPYYLVKMCRDKKAWNLGWNIAQAALSRPSPVRPLFLDKSIQEYKFFDEASLVAFYAGDKKKYIELANKALAAPTIDTTTRQRVEANLKQFGG